MAALRQVAAPLLAELRGNLQACGQVRLVVQFDRGPAQEVERAFFVPVTHEERMVQALGELLESMRWQARIAVEKALTMASLWFGVPGDLSSLADWPAPSENEKATCEGVLHDLHRVRTFLALRWPEDAPLSEKLRLARRLLFDPMGTREAGAGGMTSQIRRWAGIVRRL